MDMATKEITEFYESAKKYCDFVSNNVITKDNLEELMYLMLDSFSKGLLLPDVEPEDNDPVKGEKPNPVRIELPTTYWEIFHPCAEEEPVCGDLMDDLSDIRDDLLEGIYDYEAGFINNAVFEWKLLHHAHWGNHAVAAVKALQHLRNSI